MKTQKSKSYHHGDLRDTLLKTAIDMIRETGPYQLSLRELAKRSHVSHGAPYRHFSDKNTLFNALAAQGYTKLSKAMEEIAIKFAGKPREQIIQSGIAYVRLAIENPELTQLMFGGIIDVENCTEELAKISEEAYQGLLTIIQNGLDAGILQGECLQTLALAVWSLSHGYALLLTGKQLGSQINSEQEITETSKVLIMMLLQGILKTDQT